MSFFYQGHTYEVIEVAQNWQDASDTAKANGGYLAQIGSKAENSAIFKNVMQESKSWDHHYIAPDGGDGEYVWIGGTDAAHEGKWQWSDGSKLNYQNLGFGGEPDNFHNQDGMAIGLDKWPQPDGGLGNAGQWNDLKVTNGLYSLIEWDGLYGTSGNDKITGSKLDEIFYSGNGADTLLGMGGNDKIEGGAGKDQLSGGSGSDTFIYSSKVDSSTKAFDTIHDFSQKQHDHIDLSDVIKPKFAFVGGDDFSGAGAEVRFDTKAGHTTVFVDTDGNGKADMSIAFDGTINFHASDFLL